MIMDFSSLNPMTSNALNLAARTNDYRTVRRLLKKINPNCIDNRGWTCLHEAAANDSYVSLKAILKHPECRPLAETHEGHTALYVACRHKSSIETILALLESQEDIANYGSTECVTPLHMASFQGRLEIMQLLIDYGAMIDVQDFDGDTPLHEAVMQMKHEAVSLLLHAGANPNIQNEASYTPFHLACFKGSLQTIHNLFPFITDINQVSVGGESPLILATRGCNHEIVQFLLENGADPHIENNGQLALDLALTLGYSAIFKTLLKVTDIDKINPSIIDVACKPHYFMSDILESLLHHNLGPEFFDYVEPFYVILEKIGDIQPNYLINAPLNAFLNVCDYIYVYSPEKFREYFYAFLMRGVTVNTLNEDECPPLVYIHYSPHTKCFKHVFQILIEHGCDVDYCSVKSEGPSFPDAFIASLTSDPSTAPVMLPYSLHCEPDELLKFAYDNGVYGRIPPNVEYQLWSLVTDNVEAVNGECFLYATPTLKHLARKKVREVIRNSGVRTTKQFLDTMKLLQIPNSIKNYLCYL